MIRCLTWVGICSNLFPNNNITYLGGCPPTQLMMKDTNKSKEEDNISELSENMSASASASASENMPAADISIKEEPMESSYIESDPEYEQGQKSL